MGVRVRVSGRKYVPAWMVIVMGPVVPERRCVRAASRASRRVLIGPEGETVMTSARAVAAMKSRAVARRVRIVGKASEVYP